MPSAVRTLSKVEFLTNEGKEQLADDLRKAQTGFADATESTKDYAAKTERTTVEGVDKAQADLEYEVKDFSSRSTSA